MLQAFWERFLLNIVYFIDILRQICLNEFLYAAIFVVEDKDLIILNFLLILTVDLNVRVRYLVEKLVWCSFSEVECVFVILRNYHVDILGKEGVFGVICW